MPSVVSTLKTLIGIIVCYGLLSLIAMVARIGRSDLERSESQFQPRSNLLFLKTHKTGSTTVVNLFQRYAYTNHLSVALPKQDDIFLGWPRLLSSQGVKNMVLASVNNTYKFNYVINHLVYEKSSITKLLDANNPKDPLVQVTLVREPIQQLRSSFNYYQILKPDGEENTNIITAMELFASDPARFDNGYFMDNWFVKSRTRNPQLADLGLTYQLMANRDQVQYYVEKTLGRFDLIMVNEMMDESCVLLKRLMRWQLRDVLYFNKYSLSYTGKTDSIPDAVQQSMHDWSWGDNLLYFKARERIFQMMNAEPKFHEELQEFKKLNLEVTSWCEEQMEQIDRPNTNNKGFQSKLIQKTDYHEAFIIDRELCANMMRNERPFTRLLQRKQRPDIFTQAYYDEIEDKKFSVDATTHAKLKESQTNKVT